MVVIDLCCRGNPQLVDEGDVVGDVDDIPGFK